MKYRPFQLLRGIACIYICLQHYYYFNQCGYGAIGVEFFFVLSGYLTTKNLVTKKEKGQYLSSYYIISKLTNILIPYYIMTFLIFFVGVIRPQLFSSMTFDFKNLVFSLLLIPGNTFYVYPGWTLTYMFLFYFTVFFVSLFLQKKYLTLRLFYQ